MMPKATATRAVASGLSRTSTSGDNQADRACGRRWPVERSNAWLLENRRLALRYDRLGFIVRSLLQAACLFLVAGRLAREF